MPPDLSLSRIDDAIKNPRHILGRMGQPRRSHRIDPNGHPVGDSVDILTGFLTADGRAQGRPVGIAIDRLGGLLVADDVGNRVWQVTAASPRVQPEMLPR